MAAEPFSLRDRSVIITGAASGIGRAAVDVFAASGAAVVAADVNGDGAIEAANAVGGRAVVGDVADAAFWVDALVAAAELAPLGAAYLNAGIYGDGGPIAEVDLDVAAAVLRTNVLGVLTGTQATAPVLAANGGGAIVATASVGGLVAFDGNPIYSASKHAVVGFVGAESGRLAETGVRLNAVCPSIVDTPMTSQAFGAELPAESRAQLITPTRIAETALDLATEDVHGCCRAVRHDSSRADWPLATWHTLAGLEANPER